MIRTQPPHRDTCHAGTPQHGILTLTLRSPKPNAVDGKAPVERNRYIQLTGATKSVNRDLDGLIEHLRFPFLKTILPRYNTPWHDSMANLREFLEEHTSYPYELIQANLDRLGCGAPSWLRPTGYAVLAD